MKHFPGIVFGYILKRLITALFVISPIVIFMVWLTMSIRYISLIVSENVSIITFLKLIVCTFPDIAGIILPVCALISTIAVLYKLQGDKELLVFMTSGKGVLSLFSPVLIFALIVASAVLYFQAILSPYSYKNFVNLQERIQSQISMSIIKPGVFNVLGDSVIYIGHKTETSIGDVFISFIPKDRKSGSNVITAKTGRYVIVDDNLYISLDKGYRQELDENNSVVSILKFENFSYDVTPFVRRYSSKIKRPYEKTQAELLNDAKNVKDEKLKSKYISEYHSRLTIPFISIINSIIVSIFLITPQNRGRRGKAVLKSFIFGIICQVGIMTLINSSAKENFMIVFNYALICFTIIVLMLVLLRGKSLTR